MTWAIGTESESERKSGEVPGSAHERDQEVSLPYGWEVQLLLILTGRYLAVPWTKILNSNVRLFDQTGVDSQPSTKWGNSLKPTRVLICNRRGGRTSVVSLREAVAWNFGRPTDRYLPRTESYWCTEYWIQIRTEYYIISKFYYFFVIFFKWRKWNRRLVLVCVSQSLQWTWRKIFPNINIYIQIIVIDLLITSNTI
jgi:hypothetical protein